MRNFAKTFENQFQNNSKTSKLIFMSSTKNRSEKMIETKNQELDTVYEKSTDFNSYEAKNRQLSFPKNPMRRPTS